MGDRVLQPYPLNRVTILGMGVSVYSWLTEMHKVHGKRVEGEEVWTINSGAFTFRGDLAFDMHEAGCSTPDRDPFFAQRREQYKKENVQVVLPKADPNIPLSYTYPLKQVVEAYDDSYYDNSVNYMLAFAFLCEPKEICLYGVDYNYTAGAKVHGYEHGRCSTEYWIGRGRQKGIHFTVSPVTTLLEANTRFKSGKIYGYARKPIWSSTGDKLTLGGFSDPDRVGEPDLSNLEPRDKV